MIKVFYAVYDRKAELYSAPFLEVKDGTAIRAIQDTVINSPEHPFAKHPQDFCLHRIGTFNDETGMIESTGNDQLQDISNLIGE